MKNKFHRELCQAIFARHLPDEAFAWDIAQLLVTHPIVGSGESATWRTSATVRVNGKHVWRGSPNDFEYDKPLEKLGELVQFHKGRNFTLYAVKPKSICKN